jgi:hypothetical protein
MDLPIIQVSEGNYRIASGETPRWVWLLEDMIRGNHPIITISGPIGVGLVHFSTDCLQRLVGPNVWFVDPQMVMEWELNDTIQRAISQGEAIIVSDVQPGSLLFDNLIALGMCYGAPGFHLILISQPAIPRRTRGQS